MTRFEKSNWDYFVGAYNDDRATFDEFALSTIKYWRTMADYMISNWDHPLAVERDDLVQEMLLGAWMSMSRWRAGKGSSARKWVTFCALKSARRWFHRQRGAYKYANGTGKDSTSHYPRSDSLIGTDDFGCLNGHLTESSRNRDPENIARISEFLEALDLGSERGTVCEMLKFDAPSCFVEVRLGARLHSDSKRYGEILRKAANY